MRLLQLVALLTLVTSQIFGLLQAGEAPPPTSASVVVRKAPSFNSGEVQGSVRVLQGQSITLNGNSIVTQNLFVPGTPTVRLNGNPSFGGTLAGSGSEAPAGYLVTLNGNVTLGKLVTRTNPTALQVVNAPPAPSGTRNVTLNQAGQIPGDFATLRNLTLNGNVGVINVPPGTYGQFSANGTCGFILGNAGDAQPAVYNFEKLTFNGQSQLQIAGPVIVTLAQGVTLNGLAGAQGTPQWLTLRLAAGNLTLNGGAYLYGIVLVPNGRVTLNGNTLLRGLVESDQLTLNGGRIEGTAVGGEVNNPPTVNAGADIKIDFPNTANLVGTASDDGQPAALTTVWSKISGPGSVTFGNTSTLTTTATFSQAGVYVLRLTADDSALNTSDDLSVFVNAAPTANAGQPQSITLPSSATLIGQAADDGLPNPPAALTYQWSKVSGPGNVTFTAATALATQASFVTAGEYVLRLSVLDSTLSAQSDVAITVLPANAAPVVNAGADQSINFLNAANLLGTASDEGQPAALTTTWSKVSGPGSVIFANAGALGTSATFSQAGVYVLRLTANDSALSTSDDLSIFVNAAPTANAGQPQTISLPASVSLTGQATDDGLPNPPAALTYQWSKISGPGNVAFSAGTALATQATFNASGEYVLRLIVSDSALSAQADVAITVLPANTAPTVNAGADQNINFPNAATLVGTATDDGQPAPLTTSWSKVSGPGAVVFANANALGTSATFSQAGVYVLRLTADDSALNASDELSVFVNAAPSVNAGQPQTINFPDAVLLTGQASDDGLPNPPAALTYQWSKVSGPGVVTFTAATSLATQASFSVSGEYVLRLSASDSALSSQSDVAITVQAGGAPTQAPVVNAPSAIARSATPLIAWTAISGATSYELIVEDIDAGQIVISEIGLPTNNYQVVTPLTNYHNYLVSVRAVNAAGSGPWSTVYQFFLEVLNPGPPIIVVSPFANPAYVYGTSTTLNVVADDDAGEASLKYTWEMITTGVISGVSFSENGTNAAKTCSVHFIAIGTYAFKVTVEDLDGLTTEAEFTVTVERGVASLTLTPSSATIPAGGMRQFLPESTDQFGITLLTSNVYWTISGGGIMYNGVLTASSTPGGPYQVIAESSGPTQNGQPVTATATFEVVAVSSSSPLIRPVAFDSGLYDSDAEYRARYLSTIEPGRVWKTATPGVTVPELKAVGGRLKGVAGNSLVGLTVQGQPDTPVTFTCVGEGTFQANQQNSVTVRTNGTGVVTVQFNMPSSGTVPVVAGSPRAAGNVKFILRAE